MTVLRVNPARILRDVTLHVTVMDTRRYAVRRWLAMKCFWVAARLLGCHIQFKRVTRETPPGTNGAPV